jgi:hypothetical protein
VSGYGRTWISNCPDAFESYAVQRPSGDTSALSSAAGEAITGWTSRVTSVRA